MKCNQCEALMINGVFCHETGCPNMRSRFDEETGEWVRQYVCGECGEMVDDGDTCCQDLDEGEEEEEEEDDEEEETQCTRFTVEIDLGNAAAQTYADVAYMLRRMVDDFSRRDTLCEEESGGLFDANGNRVGTWIFEE